MASDPPEAAPGATVSYSALIVDQNGEVQNPQLLWSYCNAPKPLSELDDIASRCFLPQPEDPDAAIMDIVDFGNGSMAQGMLPSLGCALFGPDVPPAMPNMPPGRPTDPDPTGGYYQPVRLVLQSGSDQVLGAAESRLVCGLPGATPETLTEFKAKYKANENPKLANVKINGVDAAVDDGTSPGIAIPAGRKVTLEASWNACPSTPVCGDGMCSPGEDMTSCPMDCMMPKGCTGAEPYAYFDPNTRTVTDRQEVLTISWYATQIGSAVGTFDTDRSVLADAGAPNTSTNGWTAPNASGSVFLWAVIRDDRGGLSWNRYKLAVGM